MISRFAYAPSSPVPEVILFEKFLMTREIFQNAPNLICQECDVSNETQVTETIKQLEGSVGPIQVLVNSAGKGQVCAGRYGKSLIGIEIPG